MDARRFHHLGQEWEAFRSASTGAAFGFVPEVQSRIGLRSVTEPERGEYRTSALWSQLAEMSDADLVRLLEGALTLAAIDRSPYVWRTAEGIAKEIGIDARRVREYLQSSEGDEVLESEETDTKGRTLYTTQDHFVRSLSGNSYVKVESST